MRHAKCNVLSADGPSNSPFAGRTAASIESPFTIYKYWNYTSQTIFFHGSSISQVRICRCCRKWQSKGYAAVITGGARRLLWCTVKKGVNKRRAIFVTWHLMHAVHYWKSKSPALWLNKHRCCFFLFIFFYHLHFYETKAWLKLDSPGSVKEIDYNLEMDIIGPLYVLNPPDINFFLNVHLIK